MPKRRRLRGIPISTLWNCKWCQCKVYTISESLSQQSVMFDVTPPKCAIPIEHGWCTPLKTIWYIVLSCLHVDLKSSTKKHIYIFENKICLHWCMYTYTYMRGWSIFFLPGITILSPKKSFSQTCSMPKKRTFAGPYVGVYMGIR